MAEDECGNIVTETQTITVEDTEAPVLSGIPAEEVVECDAVPTPPVIGTDITATDDCDPNPSITLNETITPGSCPGNYTITREWSAEDACGNITTESQTIIVQDRTPPVLSGVPADVAVECDAIPAVPVIGTDITATDNCDTNVDISFSENITPGSCAGEYIIDREWTAEDDCGNITTESQRIVVSDTQAPVLSGVPADVTVGCSAVPTAPVIGTDITATDNCDATPTITLNETTTPGTCAGSYNLTREWIAEDECGNSVTESQTITVEDTTPPTLTGIPADVTVECDAVPAAPTIGTDITATDDCDANPNITINETTTPGTCDGSYILTREWTAEDECGNTVTETQTITVQDLTAPVLSGVPADVTVECDGVPTAPVIGTDVTATDNCDPNPTVTLNETTTPGSCSGNYTLVREWTAEDACGNIVTATQTISVEDTEIPVLSGIPSDVTVECDDIPAPPANGIDITATDNCDTDVDISFSETVNAGICPGTYSLTREWTATDD